MSKSTNEPIILRIQSQKKLREMEQKSKLFECSWRLRRRKRLLLRREVKET